MMWSENHLKYMNMGIKVNIIMIPIGINNFLTVESFFLELRCHSSKCGTLSYEEISHCCRNGYRLIEDGNNLTKEFNFNFIFADFLCFKTFIPKNNSSLFGIFWKIIAFCITVRKS